MLRISLIGITEAQVTLRLEGAVNGRWVEELRRECDRLLSSNAPEMRQLVLDVANVSSIDAEGLALFRELSRQRVFVTNCSPYVAELLHGVIDADG